MLPAIPLSQLSNAEVLEFIRATQAKRVATKERAPKTPRARKNQAAENLLEQINAMIAEDKTMSKPLILGSSNAGTWRDCHEKYRLRYVEHLVPKKPDMKTTFGSAFHGAADTYYKTEDMEQSLEKFVDVARTADLPQSMDHETKENPRSIERGINLFEAWVAKYEKEPFKLMRKPDGTPFTELRFTLNIGEYNGIQIAVTGTIDKIVEAGNRIYVLDIKTTRRGLSQFQNSMRPNHQLTGYFAGAREFLGDKVFSVGYDAIFYL